MGDPASELRAELSGAGWGTTSGDAPRKRCLVKKKKRRHLFSCLSLSRISVTQNIGEQADVWPPWKAWGRALLGTLALLRPAVPSWNLLAASPGL